MAANVLDDTFNISGSNSAIAPAIALNVLANDDNGVTTQAVSAANIDTPVANPIANTASYVIPARPAVALPQRSLIVGGIAVPSTSTDYADIDLSIDSDNLHNGNATLSNNLRTEAIVLATSRDSLLPHAVLNYNIENANTQLSSAAAPSDNGEFSARAAVARFPYAAGWIGGSYNAVGTAVVANAALSVSTTAAAGQYIVAVNGVTDSRSDGYLFTIASGDSDNYSHALPLGGNLWQVTTRDNAATFADGENTAFSVLYVPRNAQGLIGGHIRGDADTISTNPVMRSNGNFSIARTSPGTWNMSIPGHSPASGMLIFETADYDRDRGANVYFNYSAASNGTDFVIRQTQREGGTTNLLNDDFIVFFVPFENQLQPVAPLALTRVGTASSPSSNLSANGVQLTINSDNTVTYGMTAAQLRALAQGQVVTDTFVYQASDGVNTASATSTIYLRGVNDAPTLSAAIPTLNFIEDGPIQSVDLTTIFSDLDTTDVLTYRVDVYGRIVSAGTVGNTLHVDPQPDKYGAFSYTVTATDSFGASVTSGLFQGNVTPVVEGARAMSFHQRTSKFTPIDVNVLNVVTDPEASFTAVAAGNIWGNIDATTDAATMWSVRETSAAPNNLQIVGTPPNQNLGDVTIGQNGGSLQQTDGVLLATVAVDSAPYSSVNSYGYTLTNSQQYKLSTRAGIGETERNTPLGAAFFPFEDGWTSGHVDTSGILRQGIGVSQANITRVAAGLFEVEIPEATNSETSGLLFAITGANDDNITSVRPIPGTNRWQVRISDNDDTTNGLEDDGFSFVYIPGTTPGLIGGRYDGITGALKQTYGLFSITGNFGDRRLLVHGHTPESGTLLLMGSGATTAVVNGSDMSVPQNLLPASHPVGNQFLVRMRASGTLAEVFGDFQFIFLPHASPLKRLAPNPFSVTAVSATSAGGATVTINPNGTVRYDASSAGGAIAALQPGQSLDDTFTYTITDSQGRTSTAMVTVVVSGELVVLPQLGSSFSTSEAGGSDSVSFVLAKQPAADVTIQLASSDPTEGSPTVSAIVFTPANWNVVQAVTITGVNDFVDDGNISYSLITAAVSTDPLFNGAFVSDIPVVSIDDDTAGFVRSGVSTLVTTERGGTASFTIRLTSEPLADVTIGLTSTNTAEGIVSPAALTFNASNWNVLQTVRITGVDDAVVDANVAYQIVVSAAVSLDPLYAGRTVSAVGLTNTNLDIGVATSTGVTRVGTGMTGMGIDGRISFNGTNAFLTGGTLTVSITAGGSASDRLAIRSGIGSNDVFVSGNQLAFNNQFIGTFSGGVGAPLVVTFNSLATRLGAQAVARAVTYQDVSPVASGIRTATFALVDGDGQVSPVQAKQLSVGLKRVLELQQGVDRGWGTYSGQRDTQMSESAYNSTFTTGGDANGLTVDAADPFLPNASQVLLGFDNLFGTALGRLPAGAIITSASLVLQTNDPGDGALMHRMKQTWLENFSTWSNWTGGVQVDDVEARASFDSFWNTLDATESTGTGLMSISVTPDLRAWNSGEANNGWLLAPQLGGTDGWAFSPSEATDPNARPMLRIEWVPAGTSSIVVQQGLNGYAGTTDTRIASTISTSNADAETVGTDYSDINTPISQTLLKFDSIVGNGVGQIPVNSRVDDAVLNLTSATGNAVGHGGMFHRMLTNWTENTTWSTLVDGVATDGVEAATAISTQAGNSSLNPLAQAGRNDFEVISDLQAWTRGTANYGWMIEPWLSGTDDWSFSSSEYAANPAYRPKLEVYFTELPNNAPTDIQLSPATVAESLPTGTIVGILNSTDPDAGNTFTYTLVTGIGDTDNAAFTILGNKLQTAAVFDFETRSSYTIRVRTTDQGGQAFAAQSFEKVLTITIADANEAPTVAANSAAVSGAEGTTITNTGTWSDPNATDVVTLTASAGTVVKNANGTWSWSLASSDNQAATSVMITANDGNGGISTTSFAFTVTNVAPIVATTSAAVSGIVLTTITNTGTYSDVPADTVTLMASAGTLVNNGNGTWLWSITPTAGVNNQTVTITATDEDGGSNSTTFSLTAVVDVVDRKMFYNNSGFETVGGLVAALDANKVMLRSGATTQTTAFANVSNYTRGINGAVLDVAGLASTSITAADFIFRVAPNGASGVVNPSIWANAPTPSALVVTAGTTSAPGRVQLEWSDNQIQNTWLQIVVRANANTGLTTPAVFYLGHAQAEINGVGPYRVSVADLSPVQTGISTSLVGVNDLRDLNKDRRVTVADLSFVQARVSTTVNLNNITIPVAGSVEEGSGPSNSPIVMHSIASSPTGIAVPMIFSQSTVIASEAIKSDERPVLQKTVDASVNSGQTNTLSLVSQMTNSSAQRKSQGAGSAFEAFNKQWSDLVDNYFNDL